MIQLQMIIFYTTWLLFTFVVGVIYANYHYYGDLSLNLYIVTLLVRNYPFATIFIIFILTAVIVYQYRLYREKLNNRRNCQITFVDLEKIAHLWLEYEEIEDNIEHKMMEKMEISFDESKKDIQEVINTLIGRREIQDMSFYKKYVFDYLDSFSKQELEIVATLYELLETRAKELPSVATLYRSDTDTNIYKDIVSENLTSYQILYEVNLFDHTMNVVRCMYEILILEKDSFVFNWSKMLISSLAHDIGKIEKIESLQGLSGLDRKKYESNNHENISRLIISNAFPNYEYIDDVCEIVEKHHINSVDEKNKNYKAIRSLKDADQMARKQEIKDYLTEKKYKTSINTSNNEEKKELQENNTNSSVIEDTTIAPVKLEITNNEIIEIEETKEILTPKSETENININPNQEKNFNASDIGSLVELLIKSINETEETPKTKRVKIVSISNKDELFIPLEIFVKFTKQYDLGSTDKELKELLDKLKKDGLFKYRTSYIEIKGFANAMYNTRKDFVVFDLSSLGITEDEAELKKRNNQHLRNVTISKRNKDE